MEMLISIFREVRDPRDVNARHLVASMLFVSLAATLCGAKSAVDIADFGEANETTLGEIVELPHGVPSHDCFSRLFRLLDPEQLAAALSRFGQAMRAALGLGPPRAGSVIAVDGKSLRGGYERGRAFMPPMMVSVWDAETRLSIAAQRAANGDEVGATLALLKNLVLKGCVVTGDALHCHPRMAQAVLAAGADYALGLKANNAALLAAAQAAFAQADNAPSRRRPALHERRESGHDRHEKRRVSVIAAPPAAPDFPGLAAFARIEAERLLGATGKRQTATRYIALSKRLPPERVLAVVRAHWSIENDLHWQLDVVFHEDDARTRKDYAPQNLAAIRRIALDMLRSHPINRSIARKMKLAAWSKEFFFELFTHMR